MNDFRYLPNLSALRAFEAAARHESFSLAAQEIHLTHGAISHQVRQLEQELGVSLFLRKGKRLSLTESGYRYAKAIRLALLDLSQATQTLQREGKVKRLSITALPSFGVRWLVPRLADFVESYPELEVSLSTSSQLVDFSREAFDIGIRHGSGNYPGLHSELLMHDVYYPVANPEYVRQHNLRTIADLQGASFLRSADEPWTLWFRAAGLDWPEPAASLVFEDSAVLLRAAIEGQGVALGRHSIVDNDIQRGLLQRLFEISVISPHSYYLVGLPQTLQKPQVQCFIQWIKAKVDTAAQKHLLDQALPWVAVDGFGTIRR